MIAPCWRAATPRRRRSGCWDLHPGQSRCATSAQTVLMAQSAVQPSGPEPPPGRRRRGSWRRLQAASRDTVRPPAPQARAGQRLHPRIRAHITLSPCDHQAPPAWGAELRGELSRPRGLLRSVTHCNKPPFSRDNSPLSVGCSALVVLPLPGQELLELVGQLITARELLITCQQ